MTNSINKLLAMSLASVAALPITEDNTPEVFDISTGINRRSKERQEFWARHTVNEAQPRVRTFTPKQQRARAKAKAARKARRKHR